MFYFNLNYNIKKKLHGIDSKIEWIVSLCHHVRVPELMTNTTDDPCCASYS